MICSRGVAIDDLLRHNESIPSPASSSRPLMPSRSNESECSLVCASSSMTNSRTTRWTKSSAKTVAKYSALFGQHAISSVVGNDLYCASVRSALRVGIRKCAFAPCLSRHNRNWFNGLRQGLCDVFLSAASDVRELICLLADHATRGPRASL